MRVAGAGRVRCAERAVGRAAEARTADGGRYACRPRQFGLPRCNAKALGVSSAGRGHAQSARQDDSRGSWARGGLAGEARSSEPGTHLSDGSSSRGKDPGTGRAEEWKAGGADGYRPDVQVRGPRPERMLGGRTGCTEAPRPARVLRRALRAQAAPCGPWTPAAATSLNFRVPRTASARRPPVRSESRPGRYFSSGF